MTNYSKQWVRYLDMNLKVTAERLANKPGNATHDVNAGGLEYFDAGGVKDRKVPSPLPGLTAGIGRVRLIIVTHGDPGNPKLVSREFKLDAGDLARIVQAWLGGAENPTKVDRISLHTCWAAGRLKKPDGNPLYKSTTAEQSFAWAFARYCGSLTKDITARNMAVGVDAAGKRLGTYSTSPGPMERSKYTEISAVRKEVKFVFTPHAESTVADPRDPTFKRWGDDAE